MHELAITQGIIDIASAEKKKQGFSRVLEIRLVIGEYSGIVWECLREFFPLAAKGSCAEGAELVINTLPAAFRCADCGYSGAVGRHAACCPVCGSEAIVMTSGREFYVDSLKVE